MGERKVSRFTPPFTDAQLKTVAIVPKIAAFPAIIGSLFIVQHVLRSKKRRGRVYHRILLMMSANDFIYSVKSFVSTWPIPEGTPFVYGAVGNTATCTAAGFLGHGGALTSVFYNGSLTLFFFLMVRHGWKESFIQKRVEFWLHLIPFTIGWSTATAGLFLDLFNAFGWTCWINSYPLGCIDNVNCERGNNAGIYRWAFFHAELWAIYGATLVAMLMIYRKIFKKERNMKKYVFRPGVVVGSDVASLPKHPSSTMHSTQLRLQEERKQKLSSSFAIQATFYAVVFFFTWIFPMIQAVLAISRDQLYYPLILLASMLSPIQGFANAAIYLRPRYVRFREENEDMSRWQALKFALGQDELKSVRATSNLNVLKNNRSHHHLRIENVPSREDDSHTSRTKDNSDELELGSDKVRPPSLHDDDEESIKSGDEYMD